ncbi:PH domain-containing protein [Christiangramia sp. LLG6405-1]|uniref:PH domain-containing protein n=1 Tax=Christiangramia sp. LLG6405-1 TaxID=3160832 RepID=UPI0038631961
MKFRAKKDILFQFITYGLTVLSLGFYLFRIFSEGVLNYKFLLSDLVMILILIPLIWAQFSTKYELTEKELIYQSGPIKGKIEIERIREIIKGKSLWVGLKPAIARKGLIIKYDKYDEIYISPESNEMFVNKIRKINPKINVVNIK